MEAKGKRKLKDGTPYDGLISRSDSRDKLIAKQAGVPDTLTLVRRVATEYRGEVAKLAEKLAVRLKGVGPTGTGIDLEATVHAGWDFVFEHIQYHLDEPGLEQVRHPARSWADRVRGVDCEDYAVFLSAILQNLHIPHIFRISAYKGGWQHIYLIVPKGGRLPAVDPAAVAQLPTEVYTEASGDKQHLRREDYITLDCVTDAYNFEVPPSKTMNLAMPALYELSGFTDSPTAPAGTDTLIVASYPSESGHSIGIGDLGGFFVRVENDPDLNGLGDIGAIGRYFPYGRVRKALQGKQKKISRKARKGAPIKKLVGDGGLYRNPAEIPGATNIAAAWRTDSNHYVGVDHLGGFYVMDHNDDMARLGQLSGLDLNDPELSGWLKNAFKKVGSIAKKVGNGIATGVQKGVFDNLNKIPGVKYLADNYGSEILQAAGGIALSAVTGGAATPFLAAAKIAKAGSIAAKVGKAASLAAKAKKAVQVAAKAKKVVKAVSVAKKAVKVVKVAKKATALLPRRANTGTAMTLTENPQPLSFMPANPAEVQDFAPTPLNLVQRVDTPAYAEAPASPTIPLSPETTAAPDDYALEVVPTASVVEPELSAESDEGTYAQVEEQPSEALELADEEVGQLGALGLNTSGVVLVGGAVLAMGLAAIWLGSNDESPRRRTSSDGLSGTTRRKKSSTQKRGRSRTINL